MGKNAVAQVALGRTPEDEFQDNLRHVSAKLNKNTALFFTNRERDEVEGYFKALKIPDFAKGGDQASETVILQEGYIFDKPTSMLDQLRQLGAVVEIENGHVVLKNTFVAAKKGVHLTPEQAKMLTHLDKKLGMFELTVNAYWGAGEFEDLS